MFFPFPRSSMGAQVIPGSQDFTATGSDSFDVPPYNILNVTVNGPGGGGAVWFSEDGSAGTPASSFASSTPVVGNPGGGGSLLGTPGADGTATGGDTNTTGGGSAGGAGFSGGGAGGAGGQAVIAWSLGEAGAPSPGASITVVVGAGGAPAAGATAGTDGSVNISWS